MVHESERAWGSKIDPGLTAALERESGDAAEAETQLLIRLEHDAGEHTREELAAAGFRAESVVGDIVTGHSDLAAVPAIARLPIVRAIEGSRPLWTEGGEAAGGSEWGEAEAGGF